MEAPAAERPVVTNQAARMRLVEATGDDDLLFADGFDDAIIGHFTRCGEPPVVTYSYEKCLDVLMAEGMEYEEAVEWMEFNVVGAWVGERTPAFVSTPEPAE